MQYRQERNYENLQKAVFDGVGQFGIPELEPVQVDCKNWISFNFARGCEEPQLHGVHFFIDDYQFNRCWTNPDRYAAMLRKFQAVCTPDFSTYTDFPIVIQLYNHYRKHWLGAFWQSQGITVVPSISWSDEDSFSWCFDGEPKHSCVAVSSVGTQGNSEARDLFLAGYQEMLTRLEPTQILFYGNVPDVCRDTEAELIELKAFTQKWREGK